MQTLRHVGYHTLRHCFSEPDQVEFQECRRSLVQLILPLLLPTSIPLSKGLFYLAGGITCGLKWRLAYRQPSYIATVSSRPPLLYILFGCLRPGNK